MKLLLDSHTWLWLAGGVELSRSTVALCRAAAAQGDLHLSPFSVLEVARKAQAGGIDIEDSVPAWIDGLLRTTEVRLADVTFDVAVDISQLPEAFHKDPVDRALAATCRVQGLTLLTRDRALLKLAPVSNFRALAI